MGEKIKISERNSTLERILFDLQTEIDDLTNIKSKLIASQSKLKAELVDRDIELHRVSTKLNEALLDSAELMENFNTAKNALQVLNNENLKLCDNVENLDEQLRVKLEHAAVSMASIKNILPSLDSFLTEKKNEILKASDQLEVSQRAYLNQNKEFALKDLELIRTSKELDQLRSVYSKEKNENSKASKEVDQLRSAYSKEKNENSKTILNLKKILRAVNIPKLHSIE